MVKIISEAELRRIQGNGARIRKNKTPAKAVVKSAAPDNKPTTVPVVSKVESLPVADIKELVKEIKRSNSTTAQVIDVIDKATATNKAMLADMVKLTQGNQVVSFKINRDKHNFMTTVDVIRSPK